jgi:hypothetical protein
MLTRLSYTDFDGDKFLNSISNDEIIHDTLIEKYAPNVADGVKRLSIWAKRL